MKARLRRTAIFGGSFNPIHLGHIGLAKQVLAQGLADDVWLMVSPQNPLKPQIGLLGEAQRLALARKAVADTPGIQACDYEFRLPRPSYTWHTLRSLRREYGSERTFALVIGSDNWVTFSHWAHSDELLSGYRIIIYPREGFPADAAALPGNVTLLRAPLYPYSSTTVREAVRNGADITQMVPKSIATDVRRLYGGASNS
ncbi:MAG: nicotinate (nicotinamide) nucleotide adenylyltransferase [Alloprevotella sp.]|nr:nicotinate (nicotinamide) nucleotide adenylyltransferase [Alloprevotella sp.]